jgi:hypothetical protein
VQNDLQYPILLQKIELGDNKGDYSWIRLNPQIIDMWGCQNFLDREDVTKFLCEGLVRAIIFYKRAGKRLFILQ